MRRVACSLIFLCAGSSVAQVSTLTLPEALQQARERWPQVQAAKLRLEAAAHDVDAANGAWLPTVGAMAELVASTTNNSTTTVINTSAVDLPRIGATPLSATPGFTPSLSTVVAIGARQTLWDFGRITAQADAARALQQLESARLKGTRLSLDLEVRRAFYAVLAARAVLDESHHAFDRAQAHRDFAKKAVEAQVRPPIELTRSEADFARAEVGRIRAESGVRSARVLLAALVGAETQEVDARGDLATETALPAAEEVLAAALETDPSLAAASASRSLLEKQVDALTAQGRPTLFATASISGRNGGAAPSNGTTFGGYGLVPAVPNYDLGVVLSWQVFDGTLNPRVEAASARARAAQAEVETTKVRVSQQALQLAERARVADLSLQALEHAADAARANAAQADARFKAGLGTSLEIADAELLRTDAEINVAIGRFEALTARAALTNAMAGETP